MASFDELRSACLAYRSTPGADLKALLKRVAGVDSMNAVLPKDYDAVIAACGDVAAPKPANWDSARDRAYAKWNMHDV